MPAFKNLRLAVRLGLGFGTLAVALLVVGLLAASRIGGLDGDIKSLDHRELAAVDLAGQMSSRAQTVATDTTQHLYVFDGDLKNEDALATDVKRLNADNDRDAATLAGLTNGTEAADDVKRFADARQKFEGAVDTAIARSRKETLANKDNRDGSRNFYLANVRPAATALSAAAANLQDNVRKLAGSGVAQASANAGSAKKIIWIVALLALVAAAALAAFITRSITRPVSALGERLRSLNERCLTDLTKALQAAAQGDLTSEVSAVTTPCDVDSSDELGQLADTFNGMLAKAQSSIEAYTAMRGQLGQLIGDVTQSAETVSAASEQMASTSDEAGRAVGEIANAVGDVAQGAERQVRMVENTRTAVQEAARAAGQSAQSAAETAQAAEDAREAAREGVDAAEHATGAIRQVAETSAQVAKAIEDLSARSEKIGGIVTTITGIAEQTNLLALNAAIEAARAGEQGRGFAVVAEEVRKLAEESQDAAGQISELIGEIQGQTQQVVGVVSEGAARTEEGVATVERTREAFERIDGAVEAVGARIAEIAAATEQIAAEAQRAEGDIAEVASVAEESSASAEQVSASTEQTSASTQEIASSATELANTAEQLNQLVGRFRV
jgi:methyl-accepting chemotaxis protein